MQLGRSPITVLLHAWPKRTVIWRVKCLLAVIVTMIGNFPLVLLHVYCMYTPSLLRQVTS